MGTKLGRNDQCFCGSRKKYKKCCMMQIDTQDLATADFNWYKLRDLERAVFDEHLVPYLTEKLPAEIIKEAIDDCLPDSLPEALDREQFFTHFFVPWCLFNWIPHDDFGLDQFKAEETVAGNYLLNHSNLLSSSERQFVEVLNQTYYSFYTILSVEENITLHVKDIFLGTTHVLKERQGTHYLQRGDIIYSRILILNGQSIFIGMAPVTLPPGYQRSLIDFRKCLVDENDGQLLTAKDLRNEFDTELVDYFFEILEDAYNRPLPTLVNTDGELVQPSKSYFKLTLPPEEVLVRTLPMTLSDDPQEFLCDAEYTECGKAKRIECPWLKKGNKKHKTWDNTMLGHLLIEEERLILDTNSEERTNRAKVLLDKYLGDTITFQQTLIESIEQTLASMASQESKSSIEQFDPMAIPEVQTHLKEMAKAHWESWFNESIPALDNMTPREAAKTADGKERLEALLLEYERHDAAKGEHPFKADIDYLRKVLVLD